MRFGGNGGLILKLGVFWGKLAGDERERKLGLVLSGDVLLLVFLCAVMIYEWWHSSSLRHRAPFLFLLSSKIEIFGFQIILRKCYDKLICSIGPIYLEYICISFI